MKLWKAFTNSMINLLSVLDNFTEGTNELSLMYKDACHSARQEQALEAQHELGLPPRTIPLFKLDSMSREGLIWS
mgnify:CR=1 FL=1|jgi:hypothetical protein